MTHDEILEVIQERINAYEEELQDDDTGVLRTNAINYEIQGLFDARRLIKNIVENDA